MSEEEQDNPCPKCGQSDLGGVIPEDIAHHYGGGRGRAIHWRKHIGIYDARKDRTVSWQCSKCSHNWERI